jgi:hypothetical protein
MDWLIAGATALGGLAGYFTAGARRNSREGKEAREYWRKQQNLRPTCVCGHLFNQHELYGKKCLHTEEVHRTEEELTSYKRHAFKSTTTCSCIGYLGPDPMASGYWMGDGLKAPTKPSNKE